MKIQNRTALAVTAYLIILARWRQNAQEWATIPLGRLPSSLVVDEKQLLSYM